MFSGVDGLVSTRWHIYNGEMWRIWSQRVSVNGQRLGKGNLCHYGRTVCVEFEADKASNSGIATVRRLVC